MKRLRYIIVLVATLVLTASGYAQNSKYEPVFAQFINQSNSGVEHSYMSRMMLKKMASKESVLKGVPTKFLDAVEIVSFRFSADDSLSPIKKKLIADMELYGSSTSKEGIYSEIYVKCKDGCKTFEKLLVINWGRYKQSAKALYMVGEIPADNVDFDNL